VALFAQFSYLQILDLLTTIASLSFGLEEGNPLVRLALGFTGELPALLIVKTVAIGIGLYCWYTKRYTVLYRANYFFATLAAWNLLALIIGSKPMV
jgi:hypothetical protein